MLKEPMPTEGLYDVLSLYIHPQSFPSRPEARLDPASGQTWLEADSDLLRWASTWVISCWIDAAWLLFSYYQEWDVQADLDAFRASWRLRRRLTPNPLCWRQRARDEILGPASRTRAHGASPRHRTGSRP